MTKKVPPTLLALYLFCLSIASFHQAFCEGQPLEKDLAKVKNGVITPFSELNPLRYSVEHNGRVTVEFGSPNSAVTFTDLTVAKSKTKIGTEFRISIREKITDEPEIAAAEKKFPRTKTGNHRAILYGVTFIPGRDDLVYDDDRGKHAIPMCK